MAGDIYRELSRKLVVFYHIGPALLLKADVMPGGIEAMLQL